MKAAVDQRADAAEYLATSVTGVKAAQLLDAQPAVVTGAFERAIRMHTTCGCEHAVRLTRARDVLLGVTPAAHGERRLAL